MSEELGMRYELGMTCLEVGLRMGEPTYLQQAETIFAPIDAEWDLERTRDALGKEWGVPATRGGGKDEPR